MEQQPATIIKNALEGLSTQTNLMSGEIATFKQALCTVGERMNESSNKMLTASKRYFVASVIMSSVIAIFMLFQLLQTRYQIVTFQSQSFPARFDSWKGELQTKRYRAINGVSKLIWAAVPFYEVENGKLISNLN
ncbi:MAG: hypothetical protein AUJ72_03185 [Candidatus Omnitrophica bacterium CG1_02_46_14]|nr:MAG: hypothetical protein AUJ72_03185 [Candidatus Omnitrophica bacterium CG1_02_46_14]